MTILIPSTDAWITSAHLVEARLGIDAAAYGQMSLFDRRGRYGQLASEHWSGELLFTPMSEQESLRLQALLNTLDGRSTAFGVRMPTTLLTHNVQIEGTLASATTRQAETIQITTPSAGVVLPGTLLTIGDIDSASYQMCEVLTEFTSGTAVTVTVAPRIRNVIASGTAVKIGTGVVGKFYLAADRVGFPEFMLDRATPVIPVIEALD